jgi:hypothetical protein
MVRKLRSTADIDLRATIEGKFDLDVAGHYARPDVFRLVVDESAKSNMEI